MSCLECGAELGKRQKKFCSTKCMNVYNGRVMVEKRKITNPDRFQVCPECGENKAIRHFSLVDKTDASKGHREVCKKCSVSNRNKERLNRTWKDDAIGVLLSNSKHRAKKAGLEHTLTREDIIIPDVCPVLGVEMKREGRDTWVTAPSIDRIDNSRGYTPDNIVIVSRRANLLKKDATLTEMRSLVKFYNTLVADHPGLL
jgi:hypothetical protein